MSKCNYILSSRIETRTKSPLDDVNIASAFSTDTDEWILIKMSRDPRTGKFYYYVKSKWKGYYDFEGNRIIIYKYIINGLWTVDYSQPTIYDNDGNLNNYMVVDVRSDFSQREWKKAMFWAKRNRFIFNQDVRRATAAAPAATATTAPAVVAASAASAAASATAAAAARAAASASGVHIPVPPAPLPLPVPPSSSSSSSLAHLLFSVPPPPILSTPSLSSPSSSSSSSTAPLESAQSPPTSPRSTASPSSSAISARGGAEGRGGEGGAALPLPQESTRLRYRSGWGTPVVRVVNIDGSYVDISFIRVANDEDDEEWEEWWYVDVPTPGPLEFVMYDAVSRGWDNPYGGGNYRISAGGRCYDVVSGVVTETPSTISVPAPLPSLSSLSLPSSSSTASASASTSASEPPRDVTVGEGGGGGGEGLFLPVHLFFLPLLNLLLHHHHQQHQRHHHQHLLLCEHRQLI